MKYWIYQTDNISLVVYVLWHINSKLFNAESSQCIYMEYMSCYQIFFMEAFKQARSYFTHMEMVLMIAI